MLVTHKQIAIPTIAFLWFQMAMLAPDMSIYPVKVVIIRMSRWGIHAKNK
jgi:hypothetical protein